MWIVILQRTHTSDERETTSMKWRASPSGTRVCEAVLVEEYSVTSRLEKRTKTATTGREKTHAQCARDQPVLSGCSSVSLLVSHAGSACCADAFLHHYRLTHSCAPHRAPFPSFSFSVPFMSYRGGVLRTRRTPAFSASSFPSPSPGSICSQPLHPFSPYYLLLH